MKSSSRMKSSSSMKYDQWIFHFVNFDSGYTQGFVGIRPFLILRITLLFRFSLSLLLSLGLLLVLSFEHCIILGRLVDLCSFGEIFLLRFSFGVLALTFLFSAFRLH